MFRVLVNPNWDPSLVTLKQIICPDYTACSFLWIGLLISRPGIGYEYWATLARQTRMHHNAIGKAGAKKDRSNSSGLWYGTQIVLQQKAVIRALDQHFSKSVTWTTMFKGCKLALPKNRVSMTKYIWEMLGWIKVNTLYYWKTSQGL